MDAVLGSRDQRRQGPKQDAGQGGMSHGSADCVGERDTSDDDRPRQGLSRDSRRYRDSRAALCAVVVVA